ncbi:hypothetical protein K523DRAFT_133737 [Schizophyllum commune Tattone D]|nr:hypothetical protein K523DRAFT_133737 [Schizophyllum commune Tattone D]
MAGMDSQISLSKSLISNLRPRPTTPRFTSVFVPLLPATLIFRSLLQNIWFLSDLNFRTL